MIKRFLLFSLLLSVVLFSFGCNPGRETPRIVTTIRRSPVPAPVVPEVIPNHSPAVVEPAPANAPVAWLPPAWLENKSRWQGIIIHHTDAPYGSAAHEDKVHKSKGWDGLGYHFVINNGVFKNGYGKNNGLVEVGDRWRKQKEGAHCRVKGDRSNFYNEHTIGICLIGDFEKTQPTWSQMRSLALLVNVLKDRYNIPLSKIQGHKDIKPTKCPGRNFSMAQLKRMLSQ